MIQYDSAIYLEIGMKWALVKLEIDTALLNAFRSKGCFKSPLGLVRT